MRFSIHTLGTRGDAQPYFALSRELRERGHEVLVVAPAQFASMAAAEGVAFAPLPAEFLAVLDSPEAKKKIGGSGTGFGAGLELLKFYREIIPELLDAEWEASRTFAPDAILFHPKALGAPHIAAKLGVPLFLASPLPGFTPTSAFPTPLLPLSSLGPLNKPSHALMIYGGRVMFAKAVRAWRTRTLGLPPHGKAAPLAGTLYGYSPHVLPKPQDWGTDVAVTGYWFINTPDWRPDDKLAAFLAAGAPPIYVGFGSMPAIDPQQLTNLVIEALKCAGKRGLLATLGGALGHIESGEQIHVIASAPHDRLFPLMHATLHHGGAGTTGAALRAGKPTAICPFFGDQPFWAGRIVALGVGPRSIDKKTVTVDDLAATFRAMDGAGMRARAADLGGAICAENGVGAVGFIEERLTDIGQMRGK